MRNETQTPQQAHAPDRQGGQSPGPQDHDRQNGGTPPVPQRQTPGSSEEEE